MLYKRGRSIGGETIAWAHLGALDYSVPKIYQKKLAHEKSKKKKGKKTSRCFRMATTAVLRRPLLAALLPAGAGAGATAPSQLRIRRRRPPHPVLAVSSDSPKPVASTSGGGGSGGGNPEEEPPVLPLLQELAVKTTPS
jgi:hypothetical protein